LGSRYSQFILYRYHLPSRVFGGRPLWQGERTVSLTVKPLEKLRGLAVAQVQVGGLLSVDEGYYRRGVVVSMFDSSFSETIISKGLVCPQISTK